MQKIKKIENYNGFSLIELSIVLIIIGLLIAGIVGGKSLIESSKLASARNLTRAFTTSDVNKTIEGNLASSEEEAFPVLWLEASNPSSFSVEKLEDGISVGIWKDRSKFVRGGTGNNATQENETSQPTWVRNGVNGLPALNFSGSDSMNISSSLDGKINKIGSFFIVFKSNLTDSDLFSDTILDNSGVFGMGYNDVSSKYFFAWTSNGTAKIDVSTSIPAGIITSVIDNSTSYTKINGQSGDSTGTDIGVVINSLKIVSSHSNISEIIIYNRVLTENEVAQVETYLSKKYNINLSN